MPIAITSMPLACIAIDTCSGLGSLRLEIVVCLPSVMSKATLEKQIHKKEIYRISLKKRRAPSNTYGTLPATHDDKWLFLPSPVFLSDKIKGGCHGIMNINKQLSLDQKIHLQSRLKASLLNAKTSNILYITLRKKIWYQSQHNLYCSLWSHTYFKLVITKGWGVRETTIQGPSIVVHVLCVSFT